MGREVFREIVGSGETFAARLAVVWPLARVDAQVASQVTLASKRSATEQTHERTFAGMFSHVQLQVLLRADAFAAEWACEFSLSIPLAIVVL